jgi:orotidine-5'-phosphate decarboxylase
MELQKARWAESKFLCVGLDPQRAKIPAILKPDDDIEKALVNLVCDTMDATAHVAGVFKDNFSFYIGKGWRGIKALERIGCYHSEAYPDIPFILDHKGGDIGDTNAEWVKFAFEILGAHAVTLHNYMGWQAMQPYLERGDKGCYILCRTSNPGAEEFQKLWVASEPESRLQHPLFHQVGRNVQTLWNANENCGVVAGASEAAIEELNVVRQAVGDIPILSPGVGKQGGSAGRAFLEGRNSENSGIAINASSTVIHASSEGDYAEAAGAAAEKYHNDILAVQTA